VVTNEDLSKIMETNDEWIRTRTGIRERRWAEPGTGASQLGAPALQMALDNRGIKASDLDLIVVATVTPDTQFPATACRIQDMLGATNAFGFDLNAACSGFLYALNTAAGMVAGGVVNRAAVVGVDVMSTIIDLEDRSTSVLFGDGAGAVIVERVDEGLGILDSELKVDGSGACFLHMPAGGSLKPASADTVAAREHYIHQSGSEVFKKAVREMADNSRLLMDRNGFSGSELKLFVPHQANIRIMDAAAKRLELDPARMMVNIDRYANTTDATIPTALHQAVQEHRVAKGDLVALAAFGAGFTWGATLLRWAY
jgi:3-oxoacyl-[acyl-carrier-protein] synthase-3